jgi:hypothetical protein
LGINPARHDTAQVTAGVDTVHVVCHAAEQPAELRALVGVERAQDRLLGGPHTPGKPEASAPPRLGRDDLPPPPVCRAGAALDESSRHEVVDEIGHHRAVDPEVGRETELAWLVALRDLGEDLVAAVAVGHLREGVAD